MTARIPMVTPANWISGPPQGQWTYADYAALPEDGKRYEVVKGVLYMTLAPMPGHQSVCVEIMAYLRQYIQTAGLGRVFAAPTDVELSPDTIVQPDVFVLLNDGLSQIGRTRIMGAPDLVVEILSPGTMRHDLHEKFDAYQLAQVPEYWIVNPGECTVEVLALENGAYYSLGVFQGEAVLPSRVVPAWSVAVERLFAYL
jgi:Uma2 family endonuclease